MSRVHGHRCLCALTGETVAQALRRIRLERAAMALIHGPDSVARIAAVGCRPPGTNPDRSRVMHPGEITHRPALRLAALADRGDDNRIGEAFGRLYGL